MRRPSLLCSFVLLLTLGLASTAWANSVDASAFAYWDGPITGAPFFGGYDTSRTQCAQSGTSSASCEADFSTSNYSIGGSATGNATAAWGSLTAGVSQYNLAHAYASTSFSDDVMVTGGTGTGTLISHYRLLMQSYGDGSGPNAGGFVFAQGAARTGEIPQFANFWSNPPTGPVPTGCALVGLCFAESFDVSSPVSFGAVLPLGALVYMDSTGFGNIMGGGGSNYSSDYSTLQLDGFTVLDADGNVVSDAVVARQNLPASFNLDFTPEPGTWGSMLMGLGLLGAWRLQRRWGLLLSLMGLVAATGPVPAFADSVYVTNSNVANLDGPLTGTFYCQQSGVSSASCGTGASSSNGLYDAGGYVQATAIFGNVSGNLGETRGSGFFVASFSDDVMVAGETGSGTLISHYALAVSDDAYDSGPADFVFVQGSTRTGVVPEYTFLGSGNPSYTLHPPPGCGQVGECFSESFDVSSPIQFGSALPLGAQAYLSNPAESLSPGRNAGVYANSSLNLTGYTVLDANGNLVSNAVVTRQNLPASFNLDFTPEPGTWGLMLLGLAGLVIWKWRRRAVLPLVAAVAMCGVSPLWANSVSVTNFSPNGSQYPGIMVDGTTIPYCQQSSASSASCMTSFGGHGGGYGYIDAGGSISASAAFGSLRGQIEEDRSNGYLVASFGDQIVVTGGAGAGTLVAHYSLVSEGAAQGPGQAIFTFVQGSTKTSVDAHYVVNTGPLPTPPISPYCQSLGYCFAESFDVASPMEFGSNLPLGAQMYVTSPDGTFFPPNGGVTGSASVDLTGYTVIDASGNVVSDAAVTRQNLPASFNLDFTPEPGTWGLMLMGLAGLVIWKWRRRAVLPVIAVMAVWGAVPAWANSVYVSNSTGIDSSNPSYVVIGTPTPYCQQSGTSSAGCATEVSGRYGPSYRDSSGSVGATAAFGQLSGSFAEYNSGGYFVSSFGDEVIVTGDSGNGTLVTHYSVSSTADSNFSDAGAGRFSFVQGTTKTGFVPSFTSFGYSPPLPYPPPPGCEPYGLCFSENFDVMSPVQFGTALPLGAQVTLNSVELPGRFFYGGVSTVASSMLQLTGYTVLDGEGNVVSDAAVTQQNVSGLDLFPAPEPGTWGLMLMGVGSLGMWRVRRGGPGSERHAA